MSDPATGEPIDDGPIFEQPDTGPEAGPEAGPDPADEPSPMRKPFNIWGLRNTDGNISPSDLGDELDLTAGPWSHVMAGFAKQAGADGVEAWMHYVVAVVLLIDPDGEVIPRPDGNRDNDADDPDGWNDAQR